MTRPEHLLLSLGLLEPLLLPPLELFGFLLRCSGCSGRLAESAVGRRDGWCSCVALDKTLRQNFTHTTVMKRSVDAQKWVQGRVVGQMQLQQAMRTRSRGHVSLGESNHGVQRQGYTYTVQLEPSIQPVE